MIADKGKRLALKGQPEPSNKTKVITLPAGSILVAAELFENKVPTIEGIPVIEFQIKLLLGPEPRAYFLIPQTDQWMCIYTFKLRIRIPYDTVRLNIAG